MNFSSPYETDANSISTTGAAFPRAHRVFRARFFCLLLLSAFQLFSFSAFSANVRTYFINTFTGSRDTNYVIATKISSNILSSGGVIAQGIPTRLTMTNGASTNFFASGFYSLRNLSLGSGVVINVTDNGAQLYDYTNLLYSGFNTYATVYGSNLPPTYDNVTNALGFLPLTPTQTTNAILQASNALQAAIDTIDTSGGTNGGSATNVFFLAGQNTSVRTQNGSNVVDVVGSLTNNTTGNSSASGILTNSLRYLVGSSMFTGHTNFTGINTFDSGNVVIVSNGINNSATFVLTNSRIANVTVSNLASGFLQSPVFASHTNYATGAGGTSISMDNVNVYSPGFGVYFNHASTSRSAANFSDCKFFGGNIAASVWYADSYWRNCVFDSTILPAAQRSVADYSISFEANDRSTNSFFGCVFRYGGSTYESVGFIDYAVSKNSLYDCRFEMVTNASAIQTAIYVGENTPDARFYNCTFNLHGGHLIHLYGVSAGDGSIYFNNCFLEPYTNGVIYLRESGTEAYEPAIYVTGGNLTRANFGNATNVFFPDLANPANPRINSVATNMTFSSATGTQFAQFGNTFDFTMFDTNFTTMIQLDGGARTIGVYDRAASDRITIDYNNLFTLRNPVILGTITGNGSGLTNLAGTSTGSTNLYGAGIPALVVNTQGLTTVKFETNSVNFGNSSRSNANIVVKDGALWMPSAGWGHPTTFSGNGFSGMIGWGNVPGAGNNTPPLDGSGSTPWAKLSAFWYWGGADIFPSGNPWAILTAPNVRLEEGSAGVIPYNGTVELGNEDFFGKVEINYTPTANAVGEDLNVMGLSHPLQFRAKYNVAGSPGWSAPAIQARATTNGPGYGPGGDPLSMGELEFLIYPRIPNGAYSTNAWTTYNGLVGGTMKWNGWNLRGGLIQQQSSIASMVTNITLDFWAGQAQTITLNGVGTNTFSVTNQFGGATNFEPRVFRILTGGIPRDFIWPSSWTVISDYGTNVLPQNVGAQKVIHLKMESWDLGSTNIIVRFGIGTDNSFAYDTDAASFFTRSGITDNTQKYAVDFLVKAYKANNLWTNPVAIYPFVGGTSNSHAINLKSTSFNVTYTAAGVTHNANGITGNGSSGSGNTGIDPRTVLGAAGRSNIHLFVYCRTQARTASQRDFATTTTTGGTFRLGVFNDGTSMALDGPNNSDTVSWDNLAGDFRGMLGFSRPNVDANSFFTVTRSAITSRSTASTGIPTGKNLILLARSFEGFADDSYSSANLAFASVGWGYTSNELFIVRQIVDNYQNILGRKTP